MQIGPRHLRLVIAAVHHGSFRGAASTLSTRQSTLSRTIRHVEDYLGVTLFTRSSGGVRPTPAGIQFAEMAARVLEDLDSLVLRARAAGRGETGSLAVGIATTTAPTALRAALVEFVHLHPKVNVRLLTKSRMELTHALKTRALDVVVIPGRLPQPAGQSRCLWFERILIVLPGDHPIGTRSRIHWTDLKGETFLTSPIGIGPALTEVLFSKLGSTLCVEDHDVAEEALWILVSAGRGISVQCEGTIYGDSLNLVRREISDPSGPALLSFSACWETESTNPILTAFIALLETHRSASPWSRDSNPR